jgi:hypothetical protein
MICLVLAQRYFPDRRHYGPIDARALERYGVLKRLGFFPIDRGTAKGARQFLRASSAILDDPCSMLWLSPGGGFADPRARTEFEPGIGRLAAREGITFLPLALEYPFWEEKKPEALAAFGKPWESRENITRHQRVEELELALAAAQGSLAAAALARQEEGFEPLLEGESGVGGIYDVYRRLKARIAGESFDPSHGSIKAETKV